MTHINPINEVGEPISIGTCPSCEHYPTQFVSEDGIEYVIHLSKSRCKAGSVHGAIKHYREKNQELALDLWNAQQKVDELKDQIRAQEADILELYRAIRTQARGERLGMKLVPWEPTDKQLDAVAKAFPGKGLSQYSRTIYKAMVSAAPGPDKESLKSHGFRPDGHVDSLIIDDPIAPHRDPIDRPINCRESLRESGEAYPRSGCTVCGVTLLQSGCPYQHRGDKPGASTTAVDDQDREGSE